MSKNDFDLEKKPKIKGERLPCRGCTQLCRNYDRCDGRPWRTIGATSEK